MNTQELLATPAAQRGRTQAEPRAAVRCDIVLAAILAGAVLVRLIVLLAFHDIGIMADEIQYQEIAVNLVEGRGFALDERLTSWRPPLYPFLMAALYWLAGMTEPAVVRAFQTLLSLATVLLVYGLGRRVFGLGTARIGAAVVAFHPALLFYNVHLLTEVLFIFLCTATAILFVAYLASGRLAVLVASGLVLGLAALTRDIIWPTVGLMILVVALTARLPLRRLAVHGGALLAALLIVVVPWVVRNTRLQGTFTLISTNGGMVFLAGNYEHTPPDRPWRAHALPPEMKVRYLFPLELSEGVRQKLAVRRALEFIQAHPWLTLRNSVIRAANVWSPERNIVGAALAGLYGRVRGATLFLLAAAIVSVEALAVFGGLVGLCFALTGGRPGLGFHLYAAGLVLFTTLVHAPVSGHPRYHLPLIPLLALYAAHAWAIRGDLWRARGTWRFAAAAACVALVGAAWIREIVLVELGRFLRALGLS